MKTSLALILLTSSPLIAQETAYQEKLVQTQEVAPIENQTGISGEISDGKTFQKEEEREEIAFDVLSSVTNKRFVSQASELPGLPPVEGIINTTIQLVSDPGLTDPLQPLPKLSFDEPAVQARLEGMQEESNETRMLFVSATVIDKKQTVLTCYPNGDAKGQVSVVSNIDFNDFSGFDTFVVKGANQETSQEEIRKYALIMSITNEDTARLAKSFVRRGEVYTAPDTVELPSPDEPTFVIKEGDDPAALQAIADMHELYKIEREKMKTARLARERAYEERKAYLIANPPKPQDVTFRFWKRSEPSPASGVENGGER